MGFWVCLFVWYVKECAYARQGIPAGDEFYLCSNRWFGSTMKMMDAFILWGKRVTVPLVVDSGREKERERNAVLD